MVCRRLLILLGGCLLMVSAAWADGVAYVDCSNHPEDTQVFAKPRRTPDVVASLPCGERFTILLNGFIFSRIQTKDGQVGYIYSSVISPDRSGAAVLQPASTRVPIASPKPPATIAKAVPAQPQAAPAQQASAPERAIAASAPATAAAVAQPNLTTPTQTQPTPAQQVATPASAAASGVSETPANPTAPAPAQSAPALSVPAEATTRPESVPATVPEAPAAVAQPDATPAQPEPAAAEPAAPAVRAVSERESWEKPNAGLRTTGIRRMPLIELFGGYSFARFDNGGGTGSNLNGVLGSFGWNAKPWLQIVADSSYNVVTISGAKNVLYGNHYGPRLFRRGRNRWGVTPFVEALVGGTRAATTVSGTGGYTTSENCFSFKVGGGLDIHPSRHVEIRVIDVDYYRTSFGTNLHQNNYWASTGIVIRLFGGASE